MLCGARKWYVAFLADHSTMREAYTVTFFGVGRSVAPGGDVVAVPDMPDLHVFDDAG